LSLIKSPTGSGAGITLNKNSYYVGVNSTFQYTTLGVEYNNSYHEYSVNNGVILALSGAPVIIKGGYEILKEIKSRIPILN